MTYKVFDGHIMTSNPSSDVEYTCACQGIADGVYESYETAGTATPIGITQIKIIRTVENNSITIKISETSEVDLTAYKELCAIVETPIIPE